MGYFFSFISLSKSGTETGLDTCEIILLVCGLVLAYGAAGEYIEGNSSGTSADFAGQIVRNRLTYGG